MNRWDTPVASFQIEVGDHGVSRVQVLDGLPTAPLPERLQHSLNEHLHGRAGSLQLDLQGRPPVAQLTLAKLLEIPYGEVRSYAWVAKEIGRPRAVRPVANAVARNPIPVLIPCHRVIRSDGFVGEFSLQGPELKRRLLAFEGLDVEALEALAARRVRLLADDASGRFHVPSCKHGPALDAPDRVELPGVVEAKASPFRPCSSCRPL